MPSLEGRGEVRRDGRLADPTLGIEDRDRHRPAAPGVDADGAALEDRAAAVVDGCLTDAHRLRSPADGIGRIGPGEVLVATFVVGHGGESFEDPLGDDVERGDATTRIREGSCVGPRFVIVDLAVQDGQGDVPASIQGRLELVRAIDGDDFEARAQQLCTDRVGLGLGQCDDDRRAGHLSDLLGHDLGLAGDV